MDFLEIALHIQFYVKKPYKCKRLIGFLTEIAIFCTMDTEELVYEKTY